MKPKIEAFKWKLNKRINDNIDLANRFHHDEQYYRAKAEAYSEAKELFDRIFSVKEKTCTTE